MAVGMVFGPGTYVLLAVDERPALDLLVPLRLRLPVDMFSH